MLLACSHCSILGRIHSCDQHVGLNLSGIISVSYLELTARLLLTTAKKEMIKNRCQGTRRSCSIVAHFLRCSFVFVDLHSGGHPGSQPELASEIFSV